MTAPWSTQPITGAQHDAWMAEERRNVGYPSWVLCRGDDWSDPELISRRDADLVMGLFHPDTDPTQTVREYIAAYDEAHS